MINQSNRLNSTRVASGPILAHDGTTALRAGARRIARSAVVAFTVLAIFCLSTAVQARTPEARLASVGRSPLKIRETRRESKPQEKLAVLSGVVVDINGAAVPGAKITLTSESRKEEQKAASTDEGEFQFPSLAADSYALKVERTGYKTAVIGHISVRSNEALRVNAILEVSGGKVEMGMLFDSGIDLTSTSVTTTIDTDAASKLPIP